jgi:hypothetical protein
MLPIGVNPQILLGMTETYPDHVGSRSVQAFHLRRIDRERLGERRGMDAGDTQAREPDREAVGHLFRHPRRAAVEVVG